jgi:hypothetical protein
MPTVSFESKLQRLDARFHRSIGVLHDRLEVLLAAEPFRPVNKPRGLTGKPAVYLFCDGDVPFYVGRTKNLGQRLGQHCNEGSQPNQSSVAFKLACRDLQIVRQKYAKGEGWKSLLARNPPLEPEFKTWKTKMRGMWVRYVEEANPVTQALLEIYCAVALNTPHNEFETS